MTHRLRTLREDLCLTQYDLAERSGVTREAISAIELGKASPKFSTRKRLLKALGRDFAEHREVFEAGEEEANG